MSKISSATHPGAAPSEPPPGLLADAPALAELLQVCQALSAEIRLDQLIPALLTAMLRHAAPAARRVALLCTRDGGDELDAPAQASIDDAGGIELQQPRAARWPGALLREALRSRQAIVLDDAAGAHRFSADPYFAEGKPRSLLCLPLVKQASAIGVLLLENDRLPHAFTPRCIEGSSLIAAQAALALDNARLYAELQQENRQRRIAEQERERMTAALQESESRFRRMADATPDVIWITDLEPERVIYVSPSFERIWGLSVDALYRNARLWTEAIHPEDRQRVVDGFRDWLAQDGAAQWEAEFRIQRPDGGVRWIHERGVFIPAGNGWQRRVSGISTDISARREAEAALRESEERFALAVAGSTDGVWDWDIASGRMFYSERTQVLHGLVPGPTVRQRSEWRSMFRLHPDDAEPQRLAVDDYLAGRIPVYDGEWRVLHRDGSYRWVRMRGLCVRDANGRATRMAGSISDIDAQRRALAALQRSETRHALAMEAARDGHWDWIVEGDEFYASPRMLEIYGFPPETRFAGRDDFLARFPFHPEDRPRWQRAVDEHFAGRTARFEMSLRMLLDGQLRWVRLNGLCLRDASGAVTRWTGSVRDVTQQRRAEAALRESEERFALAVAGSSDGIWDWDIASQQMFLSERAQRLYGLEPGTTLRPRAEWRALIKVHPEDVQRQVELVEDDLAGGAAYDGEWRVLHPDGHYRWVRVRGTCLRDAQGRPTRMAGSVSDVDARRRAETALLRAQRLEATGILAGGIAHDFNNILAAILGYGEMAQRDARPGTRLRRDLDSIMVAGERGRSLVERILAFSRSGIGERLPVPVESVVREALDLIEATLPAGIHIETRLEAGRSAVLGDATQLHQVVMNLLTNAIQAMPSGGTLRVSLAELRLAAPRALTTGTLEAGDYLVLEVGDSGSGIAADIIDRIFEPFVTTKEPGVGSGLGLSLVHGIVSEVGGAVEVASAAGAGSTFSVYLPRAGEASDECGRDAAALPRGAGQCVLVVDDEPALVTLMSETLQDLGYRPVGFQSPLAALAAFRSAPRRFDAVISDERMPGLSGAALVRELRSARPEIPILVVSGYLGDGVVAEAREAGADEVLKKPLSAQALAASLLRLFAAG